MSVPSPTGGRDRPTTGGDGYRACVLHRWPRLTLVAIAAASFVVVVVLVQLAGDLLT